MADYTLSSGNVFKDLGLPNPDERLAKAKLAYKINRLITDKGMTQKEAAKLLGISRLKMTELRNGRLKVFTIDLLFSLLEKLEHHIETRVSPKSSHKTQETINIALSRKANPLYEIIGIGKEGPPDGAEKHDEYRYGKQEK